jgi:glycine cleavage system transcriptional repressor
MSHRFIMTAFGEDRPGIAADVTEILYANGCNLEDTSMTLLAGEFTLILLFSAGPMDITERLSKACRRLEQEKGVSAFLRPLPAKPPLNAKDHITCSLHVEGLDHAGIVYRVSRFLADKGINIVNLQSAVKASPESGTALYVMDIGVHIPEDTAMDALERGLSTVADDLHVDIVISEGTR